MKFFKYSILAFAAVSMATTFTACSDDDDFTPGAAINGVCFEAEAPATLEVPKSGNEFAVTIVRSGVTAAATYPVSATSDAPAGVLTFPASVTFAEGATVADYVIGYDASLLEEPYNVTLTFGDGVTVSPYGQAKYEFSVIAGITYTPWKSYLTGKGTYTYIPFAQQFGLPADDPDLPIVARTNEEDANDMQFIIQGWGFASELQMNYNAKSGKLTVPLQPWTEGDEEGNLTQIELNVDGTPCPMWLMDLESWAVEYDPRYESSFAGASYYIEDEGTFVIGIAYLAEIDGTYAMLTGGYGQEFFQLNGFANAAVSMEYNGMFTDKMNKNFATFNVSVGAGASKAVIAASKTYRDNTLVSAVVNGTITGVDVEPGQNQTIYVPITEAGSYQAAIVSWKNGEPNQYALVSFNIKGFGGDAQDADWTSNGVGELTDGWITARYTFTYNDGSGQATFEDIPWEVMIEKSTKTAGLYRMVDPWSDPNSAPVQIDYNEDPQPAYVEIDCSNPNFVKIAPQYSGCSMTMPNEMKASKIDIGNYSFMVGEENSDGDIITEEMITNNGLNTILEDDIVYVPEGACLFGYNDNFGYSWRDKDGNYIGYGIIYLGDPDAKLGARQKAKRRAADLTAVARALNPCGVNLKPRKKGELSVLRELPANIFMISK